MHINFCKMVHISYINVILLNFMHCISGLYCRTGGAGMEGHGGVVSYVFLIAHYLS